MNATAQRNKVRVMLWRMFAGALVGGAGTGLFLAFVGGPHMDLDDPGIMLAIVAGVSYVLIGLIVALGLVAPRTGAKLLNVEDEEEIREEGPKLRSSVGACVLIGLFLLVLAMSGDGPGNILDRQTALILAAACCAGVLIVGRMSAKKNDELTRQISLEASALTLYVVLGLMAVWAALAQLGYAEWISPLTLISGLALLQLLAIFAVSARKGLLMR